MTSTATRRIAPNAVTFTRDLGIDAHRVLVDTEEIGTVIRESGVWVATRPNGDETAHDTRAAAAAALLAAAGIALV